MKLKNDLSSHQPGNTGIVITISDTGIGIEKNQLSNIFERYYQVLDSENIEEEGTGIGLALTKELVEVMHGTIEVAGEPGKGTEFTLKIPLAEDCLSEQETTDIQTHKIVSVKAEDQVEEYETKDTDYEKDSSESVILIVEDNPELRKYKG